MHHRAQEVGVQGHPAVPAHDSPARARGARYSEPDDVVVQLHHAPATALLRLPAGPLPAGECAEEAARLRWIKVHPVLGSVFVGPALRIGDDGELVGFVLGGVPFVHHPDDIVDAVLAQSREPVPRRPFLQLFPPARDDRDEQPATQLGRRDPLHQLLAGRSRMSSTPGLSLSSRSTSSAASAASDTTTTWTPPLIWTDASSSTSTSGFSFSKLSTIR